jgi:hypothetical protein
MASSKDTIKLYFSYFGIGSGVILLFIAFLISISLYGFAAYCMVYIKIDPCALYITGINEYNIKYKSCINNGYIELYTLLCQQTYGYETCYSIHDYYDCYQINNNTNIPVSINNYGNNLFGKYNYTVSTYPNNRTIEKNIQYNISCVNCYENFLVKFFRDDYYNLFAIKCNYTS